MAQVPEAVREMLTVPTDNEVLADAVADDVTAVAGQLRKLRNDHSHGNRNYPDAVLRPWVAIAETLCRAHALRLLDFNVRQSQPGWRRRPRLVLRRRPKTQDQTAPSAVSSG